MTSGLEPVREARRLRIAFVYDALFPYVSGGAERRYHELATRLAARHDVHFFSWRYWGEAYAASGPEVRGGITYHAVGPARPFYGDDGKRTIREALAFAMRLLPILGRRRFDVVDASATPYLPLYAAWLATRLTGTPLVATWHEYWGARWTEYLPDRPIVARIARLAEAGARPLADVRVAVSAMTARRVGSNVEVVENGVDVGRIRRTKPDGVRSDVIHLGRLIDEKRVDLLLHAVKALVVERPDLRCTIVGDGPERRRLEELAGWLGIERNVSFLGVVPDDRVGGLLRASRTLALPSEREGFGISVVEAQAAGSVPVVARGRFSAAPELITDGEDGLLCEPTPAAIAAALATLLDDEARRRRMARAAATSAGHRSWDDRVLEMESLYQRVAQGRRREGRSSRFRVPARS
jgi:glycosyltransferase involved in cell wall biosynthesis